MTLAHDEANARLLDLVYGEAASGEAARVERAALEAHVATCAQCTADLAALSETRARVRTALDDAPVPARAHARILEAATQAAAPVAAAASAAAASAPSLAAVAAPARAIVPPRGPSFWEKLRGRWTLPTFATVGAVAVVAIASKVFLEPQHTIELGRDFAQAPPTEPAAPTNEADKREAEKNAPPAAAPAAPSDEDRAEFRRRLGPNGVAGALKRAPGGARPWLFGGGTLADKFGHHGASGSGAGLDSLGGGGPGSVGSGRGRGIAAAPAAPLPPKSKGSLDDLLEGSLSQKSASSSVPRAEAEAKRQPTPASRPAYASPPSGWKGGQEASEAPARGAKAPAAPAAAAPRPPAAPAPVAAAQKPAPPERAARKRDLADNPLEDLDGYRGGVPSASAVADSRIEERAASSSTSLAKKKSAPAQAERHAVVAAASAPATAASEPQAAPREKAPMANAAPAKTQAPAAKDAESGKAQQLRADEAQARTDKNGEQEQATSEEALARRADQLFAARRWSEAVAAYRELLRRYPDADLKTRWRARITQAQAEADATPTQQNAAKASKKTLEAAPAAE